MHRRHLDVQVDAVEQGPGDLGLVLQGTPGRPRAGQGRIVQVAAAAGVHGGDQLDPGGIGDVGVGARDRDPAGLERLAQGFQGGARKFRKFVHEQYAQVGERDFAGAHPQAAADQGRQRGRVVRVAERPLAQQPAVRELAGDRVDHGNLERLGRGERRQDAGQALGEHGLAGAGRADHQQVVTAGRGHLERPLGGLLALDVLEVEGRDRDLGQRRLGRGQHLGALEMVDQGEQGVRRQDLDAARPGRLAALGRRADQPALAGVGVDRRRQHPGHRADPPVQRQLAQGRVAADLVGGQDPHGDQQAERDRQVEVAAFLEQVGGRQVHGDALGRQRQAEGAERGAHPLAAFGDRLVGQADHGEGGQAGRHLHLGVDVDHVDAPERHRIHARDHVRPSRAPSGACHADCYSLGLGA